MEEVRPACLLPPPNPTPHSRREASLSSYALPLVVGRVSPTCRMYILYSVPAPNFPISFSLEGAIGHRILPAGLRWRRTGQSHLKSPPYSEVRSHDLSERRARFSRLSNILADCHLGDLGRPARNQRTCISDSTPLVHDLIWTNLLRSPWSRATVHAGIPCETENP